MTVASAQAFTWQDGWRYGLMGLPLAFVALPLYVLLPNYYARNFGVSLALLGGLLLAVRLFDTVIDPWLGRTADRLFHRTPGAVLRVAALLALVLCIGFGLLFFPPDYWHGSADARLLTWLSTSLLLTTLAYSALSILHQAWGARLGGDEAMRSRVVAWREGLGLIGVILASIAPLALGLPGTVALLFIASGLAWLAWKVAAVPPAARVDHGQAVIAAGMSLPWSRPGFRSLIAVYMVNGIAGAVPSTLFLLFIQARLLARPEVEPG